MSKRKDTASLPESISLEFNELSLRQGSQYLANNFASIEIRMDDPLFVVTEDPLIIEPAGLIENPNQKEFVYPIYDYGDRLLASKNRFDGQSMIKMYYTIEKMVVIWLEKIEAESAKVGDDMQVFLEGDKLCLRKAFEVIINLKQNWVVLNYEPGEWGSRYLETLQTLYKQGYPYPPSAPRKAYQHAFPSIKNSLNY